jgi:hypothetical protein
VFRRGIHAALASLLFAAAVPAAELHIRFSALERLLASQVFTDEGRKYVRGSRDAKCNYAWLENPRVGGHEGKLIIRAKFTGRSAWDVFGKCVGLGDSFDVRISATPVFVDGAVALKDVTAVPEGRSGFYAGQASASIGSSLSRDFRYPLAPEAKRALEDPGTHPEYPRQLQRFGVSAIRVSADALVLVLDFVVAVQ